MTWKEECSDGEDDVEGGNDYCQPLLIRPPVYPQQPFARFLDEENAVMQGLVERVPHLLPSDNGTLISLTVSNVKDM